MLVIPPIEITDAVLTSNSVAETVSLYDAGTTYAAGEEVRDDVTHSIYRSVIDNNMGNDLTDPASWVRVGPTNPWAAFDYYRNTVTTDEEEIVWEFTMPKRVNSIAFLGIEGATSISIVGVANSTEVYNKTFNLNSGEEVTGWWSYFFAPFETASELFVTDLPPFRNLVLTVTVTGPGTVGVGTVSIGLSVDIGLAQYGAKISGMDFGYKTTDKFGEYEYIRGGFSLQNEYSLFIPNTILKKVLRTMEALRGVPCVWIGAESISSTYNFGPYQDFDVTIAYPRHSVYSLTIEGLI